MTYSIVARGPSSGELGVAVQPHFFSAGSVVGSAASGAELAERLPAALEAGEAEAAHRLQPENVELAFWHGVALAANGREDEAAPILRRAFETHPRWVELLKRLAAAGLFPDDGELIARLAGTRAVSEPSPHP